MEVEEEARGARHTPWGRRRYGESLHAPEGQGGNVAAASAAAAAAAAAGGGGGAFAAAAGTAAPNDDKAERDGGERSSYAAAAAVVGAGLGHRRPSATHGEGKVPDASTLA